MAIDRLAANTTHSSLVGTIVPGSGSPVNGMNIDGLKGTGDFYSFKPLVVAPRKGFAWDVFGNGKTARIRAPANFGWSTGVGQGRALETFSD